MSGRIWLSWGGLPPVQTVNLTAPAVGVSDIQLNPFVPAQVSRASSGATYTRVIGSAFDQVDIVIANVDTTQVDTYNQLLAIEAHLKRGFTLSFSAQPDDAFAGFLETLGRTGLTARWQGNLFPYLTATPTGNERVVVRSLGDGGYREAFTLSAFAGELFQFTQGVRFEHGLGDRPAYIRHRLCWPLLCLRPDAYRRTLVTENDAGRTFSAVFPLQEDVSGLIAIATDNDGLSAGNDAGLASVDQRITEVDEQLLNTVGGSRVGQP